MSFTVLVRLLLALPLALLSALLLGLAAPAYSVAPFQVVSGDLPPFAIAAKPEQPGVLVELVELLTEKLSAPQKVHFFPWARAIATAQSQSRVAVLPMTRTPEREEQFVWLVKMAVQRFGPISKHSHKPRIDTLEQMRNLRIVVMRGSPTYDYLIRNNFKTEQILIESSIESMFKALDKGFVDVIYGSEQINTAVMQNTGRKLAHYHIGATVDLGEIWLAGSKDFTQQDAQAFQQAMAALHKDGSYARLMKKYNLKP